MRVLLFIIQKEFVQVFRNKAILPMMTILPIVQLILLSYAANNEIKEVNIHFVDQDRSLFSQRLIHKIQSVDIFKTTGVSIDPGAGDVALENGTTDVVMTIPSQAEYDLIKKRTLNVQLLVNAINGQAATVGSGYLGEVIQDFNREMQMEVRLVTNERFSMSGIEVVPSYWYNPDLDYKTFMVPGLLGEIVTVLIMLLTAMNIVREREMGTIEQVNVTPIKKWQFIIGKLLPFLVIGMVLMTVGLIAGKLIFDIPFRGNLVIIFAYLLTSLLAVLGMGLLISNFANTQQQAIFVAFFFVMAFILLSGLFTPIDSMPQWAQYLTYPNPIAHFVAVMRNVLLKGSGFEDVQWQFMITGILAVVFNSLAILTYRKTT